MSAELAFMSAVDLAQNIREKKVSSLEATENFFERIDLLDPQLHSYLTLCQAQALADARAADEAVQTTGPRHQRRARAQMQVIGVGQDHLGAKAEQVAMGDRLDRPPGTDRGEGRCPHEAVRRLELARARAAVAVGHTKRETFGHGRILHSGRTLAVRVLLRRASCPR